MVGPAGFLPEALFFGRDLQRPRLKHPHPIHAAAMLPLPNCFVCFIDPQY
jgi:hypothetical protein